MKACRFLPVFSLLILLAVPAAAQSLGDLAKKEKERRQTVKGDIKVLTNDDTGKYQAGSVTTGNIPKPSPKPDTPRDQAQGKPPADEPTDFQGRPESFWRQTLADARRKISELENEANVLTLRFADLQNKFYREDSGFTQQSIQRDIQKTLYEQDRNKEELAKAKAQLDDLEKEARKTGALPGWLSPRAPEKQPSPEP